MFLVRAVGVALAIVISSSAAVWGQGRTDVVTLLNGDRITGEIVELNRGRLELKTDDAGTIEIEWDNIARIRPCASSRSKPRMGGACWAI